jgi:hypothetical protein
MSSHHHTEEDSESGMESNCPPADVSMESHADEDVCSNVGVNNNISSTAPRGDGKSSSGWSLQAQASSGHDEWFSSSDDTDDVIHDATPSESASPAWMIDVPTLSLKPRSRPKRDRVPDDEEGPPEVLLHDQGGVVVEEQQQLPSIFPSSLVVPFIDETIQHQQQSQKSNKRSKAYLQQQYQQLQSQYLDWNLTHRHHHQNTTTTTTTSFRPRAVSSGNAMEANGTAATASASASVAAAGECSSPFKAIRSPMTSPLSSSSRVVNGSTKDRLFIDLNNNKDPFLTPSPSISRSAAAAATAEVTKPQPVRFTQDHLLERISSKGTSGAAAVYTTGPTHHHHDQQQQQQQQIPSSTDYSAFSTPSSFLD